MVMWKLSASNKVWCRYLLEEHKLEHFMRYIGIHVRQVAKGKVTKVT